MRTSTEQQLRDLFATDAAAVPERLDLAAGARHRVRRRRQIQAAWTSAAAVIAVVVVGGVLGLDRPASQPQALSPSSALTERSPMSSTGLPAQVAPGAPLADVNGGSCAKDYSPVTLAQNAFAFDGIVASIGSVLTDQRSTAGLPTLLAVTFHVNVWFKGGSDSTVVVYMTRPSRIASGGDETVPSYAIGSRLLVTGMPIWGGEALDKPVAWGCGFTRYYSQEMATEWADAMR